MSEGEQFREVRRWLRYAREDLQAAETLLAQRTVTPRHICWLAQQSAEKALKSILVFLLIDFPWIHDLDALRTLLPDDWQTKAEHPDLASLTEWATEARYPGDWADPTEADATAAVRQARGVWNSVRADFLRREFKIEESE